MTAVSGRVLARVWPLRNAGDVATRELSAGLVVGGHDGVTAGRGVGRQAAGAGTASLRTACRRTGLGWALPMRSMPFCLAL